MFGREEDKKMMLEWMYGVVRKRGRNVFYFLGVWGIGEKLNVL